jgi:N-sulfoglucosamine sulfohydrolase
VGHHQQIRLEGAGAVLTANRVHEQMYFSQPRPMFELYDLNKDPNQIQNLAGTKAFQELEYYLRIKLTKWMVREADYLPLPLPLKK